MKDYHNNHTLDIYLSNSIFYYLLREKYPQKCQNK